MELCVAVLARFGWFLPARLLGERSISVERSQELSALVVDVIAYGRGCAGAVRYVVDSKHVGVVFGCG